MQKGQPTQWSCSGHSRCWCNKVNSQCTQQIWVVGTITFSSKRSTPTQWRHSGHAVDAVDTVDAVNAVDTVDAVNAVDTVRVVGKKSTHTVYSANMGGGDHYL